MILLLYALAVQCFLVAAIVREIRQGRGATSYTWFLIFIGSFVSPGFIVLYVEQGCPDFGGYELALRVQATSALCAVFGGELFHPRHETFRVAVSECGGSSPQSRLFVMAAVILSIAWLYFLLLGRVPLFEAVGGGVGALQEARLARDPYVNIHQARVPLAGFLETVRNVGVPGLFAATFLRWRVERRMRYVVLMLTCVVTVLAAGQRWPLQYLLIATVIAVLAAGVPGAWKFTRKIAAFGIVAGGILTVAQGRSSSGAGSFSAQLVGGVWGVFERVITGYVYIPVLSYSMPEKFSQALWGATYWQSFSALKPGPGVNYSVTFYNVVMNYDAGYTASPDFATELYLNFRWPGVILGSIGWVFLLRRFDDAFAHRELAIEELGLWAMTVLCLAATATEGLVASSVRSIFVAIPVLCAFRLWDDISLRHSQGGQLVGRSGGNRAGWGVSS